MRRRRNNQAKSKTPPPQYPIPTTDQLAYMAGFFDGEGSIVTAVGQAGPYESDYLAVSVTNRHRGALEMFPEFFGGRVAGAVDCCRWHLTGAAGIAGFLRSVLSHLLVQRTRAELMLELCSLGYDHHPGRRGVDPEVRLYRRRLMSLIQEETAQFNLQALERVRAVGGNFRELPETGSRQEVQHCSPAYLAGFLDAEGSVSVSVQAGRYISPRLQVANRHPAPIRAFRSALGGRMREDSRPNGWGSCFTWYLYGAPEIRSVLQALEPYLVVKRRRAQLMMELCTLGFYPNSAFAGVEPELVERRLDLTREIQAENARLNRQAECRQLAMV